MLLDLNAHLTCQQACRCCWGRLAACSWSWCWCDTDCQRGCEHPGSCQRAEQRALLGSGQQQKPLYTSHRVHASQASISILSIHWIALLVCVTTIQLISAVTAPDHDLGKAVCNTDRPTLRTARPNCNSLVRSFFPFCCLRITENG